MATTTPIGIATATATQTAIDRLAERYVFRDASVVTELVRRHPDVVAPLLEAVEVVPRYFGPRAPLVLEVERDREGAGQTQLFALIQTDLGVDAALASLDRFDEEWWLDALRVAAPHLMFALEYV